MKDVSVPCNIPPLILQRPEKSLKLAPRFILRRRQVSDLTGLSRPTLYRMMKAGTFPKSCKISPSAVGWDSWAVQAWIDARLGGASA